MIETILLILIAVFSILLQIFIHEVGHLVFGLMTGYKFISFTILNIRVYKRDKKICVGKTRVAGAGGQCAMTPAFEENDNIPYFWYNAGGIIFNLITSIIMGLLGFCFNEGSLARTLLMFSGIIGLVFALYNGIPIRSRLVVNDAYNIFMMFNNPSARRAFWRIMKINASGAETRKLLKLPKEWFYELPDKDYRNPLLCGLAVDTIYYYLEKQYYNEALEICNEIIGTKGVLASYRNEAICEKQFCEMMIAYETNSKNIEYSLKESVLKQRLDPLTSCHIRYAYAMFVLRDTNKALQVIESFNGESKRDCNKIIVEHEKYMLGLLEKCLF